VKLIFIHIICIIALIFVGCTGTKHLTSNQLLLNKNDIFLKSPTKIVTKNISKSELEELAKPTENKEVFGFLHHQLGLNVFFRPRLLLFDWLAGGRTTNLKWWLQNKIGEPYCLFDSFTVTQSANRMKGYLFNKGYYDAQVEFKIKHIKHKKVDVSYTVVPNVLSVMSDVIWISENDTIQGIIDENKQLSSLIVGNPYDNTQLKLERERIELLLRNKGYYDFSQEFVYFVADTGIALGKKNFQLINLIEEAKKPIVLYVHIKNPDQGYHTPYYIKNIYVFPNYSKIDSNNSYTLNNAYLVSPYTFVYKKTGMRPLSIVDKIFLDPGSLYSLENHQKTINRLSELSIFGNVRFQFQKAKKDSLNGYIYLTPKDRRDIGYDLEASTNSNFVGGGVNFIYHNYNLFHRADVYSLILKGAIESPFESANNQLRTLDGGIQMTEVFPQFIFPFRVKKISKNQTPKTRLSISYNYLKRLNFYTQYQTNFAFGYDWNESKQKHHTLNPLSLNFTQYYEPSSDFISLLNKNPLLKSSFENRFIPGLNYIFTYNSLKDNIAYKNFYFLKINVDAAGNSLYLIHTLKNKLAETPDAALGLFNINYSNYSKIDMENRYTAYFGRKHYLVTRLEVGLGAPYGYSKVLPYSKQFFSGGPNGLRGWRVRTLGPGSYYDSTANPLTLNQTGDSKLEANLEYRFNLWSSFKGAIFADAGNIWLLKKDNLRPGAEFGIGSFYKQIAVAVGSGIRFDYDYFVIRLDVGIPLIDPIRPYGKQWRGDEISIQNKVWRKNNLKYNLAIAYPF